MNSNINTSKKEDSSKDNSKDNSKDDLNDNLNDNMFNHIDMPREQEQQEDPQQEDPQQQEDQQQEDEQEQLEQQEEHQEEHQEDPQQEEQEEQEDPQQEDPQQEHEEQQQEQQEDQEDPQQEQQQQEQGLLEIRTASEVSTEGKVPKSNQQPKMLLKPIKPRVEEARKEEEEMKTLLKSSIFQLEEELFDLYTASDEEGNAPSENDVVTSQENAEHVRKLVERFLSPVILSLLSNTTQIKLQTKSLKMQMSNQKGSVESTQENKRKTSWSIYLSEYAKNLPGWKETTAKLTFASAEYKKLSPEEKEQIVIQYYTSRNIPVPGTTHHHQKVARISGLDAFRKHWYEARKQSNPEARGLDSMRCTKDWAALSDAEKAEWKELRRQEIAGQS